MIRLGFKAYVICSILNQHSVLKRYINPYK